MARRQHLTLMLAVGAAFFFILTYFMSSGSSSPIDLFAYDQSEDGFQQQTSTPMGAVDFGGLSDVLSGGSIMPKLGNETLKCVLACTYPVLLGPPSAMLTSSSHPRRAELGHATWKFLHTMVARYPDEPTEEDQLALKTFITLLSRLYPCGECAEHFRQLLAKYPPQVSSRNAAAGWLCYAHNIVNKRLKKPDFDCTKIGDFYDCGCADDPGKAKPKVEGEGEGELKE